MTQKIGSTLAERAQINLWVDKIMKGLSIEPKTPAQLEVDMGNPRGQASENYQNALIVLNNYGYIHMVGDKWERKV